VTAAVSFATVSACSAITSFEGLSGEAPSSEAGTTDASVDHATTDGSIGPAPTDGGTTMEAGGGVDSGDAGCRFCDDFDDRFAIMGNWTNVTGSGRIQSTVFKSPPRAALMHIDAVTMEDHSSDLVLDLPLQDGSVTIDFDFKLGSDVSGHTGNMNLLGMSDGMYLGSVAPVGGGSNTFYIDDWLNFPDGGHRQDGFPSKMVHVDQAWHHMHYAVKYAPAGGKFNVVMDTETIVDEESFGTYGGAMPPPKVTIYLGIYASAQADAVDMYIDNVAIY